MELSTRKKVTAIAVIAVLGSAANAEETIGIDVNLQTQSNIVSDTPEEAASITVSNVISTFEQIENEGGVLTEDQTKLKSILVDLTQNATTEERKVVLEVISPKANTANATVTRRNPVGFNLQSASSRFSLLRQSAKGNFFRPTKKRKSSRSIFFPRVFKANDSIEEGGLLDNRLSTFATLDYAGSKQNETNVKTGFEGGVFALSGGLDYRLDIQSFVGIAFNYGSASVDLSSGGGLDSKSKSFNVYGAYYYDDYTSFQASAGFGRMNYDMSRDIAFTIGGTSTKAVADSNPDGGYWGINLGAAYDRNYQQYNGGVFTNVNFSRATIDAFNETGAGGLNLHINDQAISSLTMNIGAQVSTVVSTKYGIISPYFKATYVIEFNKDDELIRAYFINDPSKTRMTFEAQTQDPSFMRTTYGSTLVIPNGILGFAQLELIHMVEDYSQYNLTVGVRKEL